MWVNFRGSPAGASSMIDLRDARGIPQLSVNFFDGSDDSCRLFRSSAVVEIIYAGVHSVFPRFVEIQISLCVSFLISLFRRHVWYNSGPGRKGGSQKDEATKNLLETI
ncbi:hypothetical protein TNCV_4950911 [Trichonephila clavipes]|nr:hypothetical protein TNCV_4950911 [Trichonephila clavipes]